VSEAARDLLAFIQASPTPFHAVAEAARRLEAAGFRAIDPAEVWSLGPGDRRFLERDGGTLIALEVGSEPPARGGFRVVATHTDSPNLRLRPLPDVSAHGYRQVAVEPYGGVLLHTWLDRDLSIAGRVTFMQAGKRRTELLDFRRPLLRVPSLAIHLQRELATDGLKLNPQQHAVPLLGMQGVPDVTQLVCDELEAQSIASLAPRDVLAFDLMLHDTQPPCLGGARGELVLAPRLDNLASCHAAVSALARGGDAPLPRFTRVIALYDHEEIGSRSARGASGPALLETLERAVIGFKGGEPQGLARALERSFLVSADMAHAVHPNYADKHEPGHRPVLGRGPCLKTHVGQNYATDGRTAGYWSALCRQVGVEPQHFVSRSDQPCGSTIGPISAARVGIRAVDVGNPMLSMHSCRELAGSADVQPMIDVLRQFFADESDEEPIP
jgi:aspartyl aminopeptidase